MLEPYQLGGKRGRTIMTPALPRITHSFQDSPEESLRWDQLAFGAWSVTTGSRLLPIPVFEFGRS
jgi:hypothetical protein